MNDNEINTILKDSWFKLSLVEQMVNIGNEVKRAIRFDSDKTKKDSFLNKAIYYTELTMLDPKNKKVLPELEISKEVLEDYKGVHYLNCSKEQINKYYSNYTYML